MMTIHFDYTKDHVIFTRKQGPKDKFGFPWKTKDKIKSVDEWGIDNIALCDALGALRLYEEHHPDAVKFESNKVTATHSAVATLDAGQARSLGLPDSPPFVFAVDSTGVIGSPTFKLNAEWTQFGKSVATSRCGAFLKSAKGEFLLTDPIYSAVELSESFDATAVELPDHWLALTQFRQLFEVESVSDCNEVEMSKFLQGLKIYTGSAFSLMLTQDQNEVDVDPVLFDSTSVLRFEETGKPLIEGDGTLPDEMQSNFIQDRRIGFRAFENAKRSYLLSGNTFVILSEDLEFALQVVREKQRASPAERRAFAANPRAEIVERLLEKRRGNEVQSESNIDNSAMEQIELQVAALFIETPEYVDRAIGIGLWQPPKLDFLPHTKNVWLPEIFAIELDGVWIRLETKNIPDLRCLVNEAIANGQTHVEFNGTKIPATQETLEALAELIGEEKPKTKGNGNGAIENGEHQDPPDIRTEKVVIEVHENFVEENWSPQGTARRKFIDTLVPKNVQTELLKHQIEAFNWQIEAWKTGHLGILNADDQGLGKTLQTLAFLSWIQLNMDKMSSDDRLPILLVSPTGLLGTWKAEANQHLKGTGLGVRVSVYGSELRNYRISESVGKDTDDGIARLEFKDLKEAIKSGNGHKWWLLTTYDTLANYQHSFRKINFSVVVFDEIQKIKNIRTLNSLAARTVKADFRIGLTGTPIENHISELWAIMDAISPGTGQSPGRLGTLQDFLDRYKQITEDSMRELHARIFKPVKHEGKYVPPVGQRRLKEAEIANLPNKNYRFYPTTMPQLQAERYEQARGYLAEGAHGSALKMLHHIRGVSLNPVSPPEAAPTNIREHLVHGARFEAMQRVLERIRAKSERALIFTEDRRMQALVVQWLKSNYGLKSPRIINGETAAKKRQQYVREFQSHLKEDRGFDVMLLSPRAAGVGLTLTAATHVVHLSRWWNSAVEEQCNDRIYRIGQTRNVTIHFPLAIHPKYQETSFDCVLNDLIKRKASLARAALWPSIDSDFDHGMLVTGVYGIEPFNSTEVDDLDWASFENWVMSRASDSGEWIVSRTPKSGDAGADSILRHRYRNHSAVVQVKHTISKDRKIDHTAVQEVLISPKHYDVQNPQLVVITNAKGFTDRAQQIALEQDVKLIDRDRLGLWPTHVLG